MYICSSSAAELIALPFYRFICIYKYRRMGPNNLLFSHFIHCFITISFPDAIGIVIKSNLWVTVYNVHNNFLVFYWIIGNTQTYIIGQKYWDNKNVINFAYRCNAYQFFLDLVYNEITVLWSLLLFQDVRNGRKGYLLACWLRDIKCCTLHW